MRTFQLLFVFVIALATGCFVDTTEIATESIKENVPSHTNKELRSYVAKLEPSLPLGNFVVVGYLPEYRVSSIKPTAIALCYTDVVLFSAKPMANGELDLVGLEESWPVVQQLKASGVKRVLLTIGGWDRSAGFSPMVANSSARKRFIGNAVSLCRQRNLDGIDLDWEFPESNDDQAGYSLLVRELSSAFRRNKLMVTAALNPHHDLGRQTYAGLNRIHLMVYDEPGQHSTYEAAVTAVEQALANGILAEKITLGVPFYGKNIHSGEAFTFDQIDGSHPLVPAQDEVVNLYFNGPATINRKVEFARKQQLGGVMCWEIGQDTKDYLLSQTLRKSAGK